MSSKPTTKDQIDVLLVSHAGESVSMEYQELIDKLQELYGLNAHKVYSKFHATLFKDQKVGWALVFEGEREESKEETAARESKEAAERKRVEDAELKMYLKLRKKYGKKKDCCGC
jgi:hypothetical protein